MILVAIDPSIVSTGLAVFRDGKLVHAESVRLRKRVGADVAQRAVSMAAEVAKRARQVCRSEPVQVVVEWPQVYRAQRAAGDPNDLFGIAAVGAVAAALLGADVTSVTPREWAGQVPKVTSGDCKASPRARRVRSRLSSASEIVVWDSLRPSDHDAVDAVGIGCHALARGPAPASASAPSLESPEPGTTDLPSSDPGE